jgi:hypothetical protein
VAYAAHADRVDVVLDTKLHRALEGYQAQEEQGGQHNESKGEERLAKPRDLPDKRERDEGARYRAQEDGDATAGLEYGGASARLEHGVLGGHDLQQLLALVVAQVIFHPPAYLLLLGADMRRHYSPPRL